MCSRPPPGRLCTHLSKILDLPLCTEKWKGRSFYYRPHMKYGEGNVFTCICHSVHRTVPSLWMESRITPNSLIGCTPFLPVDTPLPPPPPPTPADSKFLDSMFFFLFTISSRFCYHLVADPAWKLQTVYPSPLLGPNSFIFMRIRHCHWHHSSHGSRSSNRLLTPSFVKKIQSNFGDRKFHNVRCHFFMNIQ